MTKIKYVGSHESYTIAGVKFVKDKAVELTDDQAAKVKANGVGARLFAAKDLVVDEPKTKKVVNPDRKPAPKADDKASAKTDK